MALIGSSTNKNDVIVGTSDSKDVIDAGNGNDIIDGGDGDDTIYGGNGTDVLFGGRGNDWLYGGNGADTVYGGTGNDFINVLDDGTGAGDNGNDVIYGDGFDGLKRNADGSVFRDAGGRLVYGSYDASGNFVAGEATQFVGNDWIYGGNGSETIFGDNGLVDSEGNPLADAPGGDDTIHGGGGDDRIYGEGGHDRLYGDAGNDQLFGGAGADTLTGGTGNDVFAYAFASDSTAGAMDVITDFVRGEDKIDLGRLAAGGLTWGGSAFVLNSVWVTQESGNTLVHANVEGNAGFVVRLEGLHALDISDFIGVREKTDENRAPALTGTQATLSDGREDFTYTVLATDLLQGFTDADVDPLSVSGLAADHGALHDNGDGTWTFAPPANFSGPVNLTYQVVDGRGGAVAASQQFTLAAVADAPALVLPQSPVSSTGNDPILLNVSATLVDEDGSESLTGVTISGVPAGWMLSKGVLVDEDSGTYTLSPTDLTDLSITPPAGTVGSIELNIKVASVEAVGGDTATATGALSISVGQLGAALGKVIDGYIAGATVFADTNGDGLLDDGEARTTTDASGNFTLLGGSGPLVMYGGFDVSTGHAFQGVMRAPEGSTVVTPLTTLIAEIVGPGATTEAIEAAAASVVQAFGLAPGVDLLTLDPVAAVLAGGDDATAGAQLLAAGIQVQNTIVQISSVLAGAGAPGSQSTVMAQLALLVQTLEPNTQINLADANNVVLPLISASANASGVTQDLTAVYAAAATVIVATNAAVATALESSEVLVLQGLAQVAAVAQGSTLQQELATAASTGATTSLLENYTEEALTTAIAEAPVGDVNGGLVGTLGNDTLTGTTGNDAISGLEGNDLLIGLAGNDTLLGGPGNDTLRGGPGNDVLNGGILSQLITVEDFRDLDRADYSYAAGPVNVNLATGIASAGVGDTDTLLGIEGVVGSSSGDTLTGSDTTFYEFFIGGPGNDTIDGAGFLDRAFYDGATGPIDVLLGSGDPAAPSAAGTVTGNASVGTDTLLNVEMIQGSAYDDTFRASGFVSASAPGGLPSTFNDFEGGGGNDTVYGNGATRVSYQYAPGAVTVTLVGPDTVHGGSYGTATGDGNDTLFGVNSLRGSNYGDTFHGGTTTASQIYEGRGGDDTIYGGPGYDQARYAFDGPISVGITVNLAAGTVVGDPVYTGTDTLRGVEAIQGSILDDVYDARGFGPGSTNAGSLGTFNEFEGMAGNDLVYTNGNTRVSYFSAREAVTVNLNMGTELIDGVTYNKGGATGGASVGSDTFYGVVTQVRGSNFDDVITGRNNIGPGGTFTYSEIYQGRGGNDTIDGGGGWDIVWYNEDFTSTGITVVRHPTDAGKLIVTGDIAIGSDTLIRITSIRGTDFADVFDVAEYVPGAGWGGISASLIEIEGGGGNDIITGNGSTRVTYLNSGSAVYVNLAAGTASGTAVGTDTFLGGVRDARGSNFDDMIIGDGNGNNLEGQGGNDTLRGGDGNDTIDGGGGLDILDFSDATDGITFTLLQGTNGGGFWSTGSLPGLGSDLYRNMEGVIGSSFDDSLVGSAGNDVLLGGNGNDTLAGGAGNDILVGGPGDDLLTGGAGADTFVWKWGDAGTAGSPAVDVVTDFDFTGQSDKLDLRDLLVGEAREGNNPGNLGDFLDVVFDAPSTTTTLNIRSGGSGAPIDQIITLQGYNPNLPDPTSFNIIARLLEHGKLITD